MIALHDLLSAPPAARAPSTPVCWDGAVVRDHAAFRARSLAAVAALRTRSAQRVALCIGDPFDFACVLFALFACGKTPVIPASATPGYLADLADAYDAVLIDADMPALCAVSFSPDASDASGASARGLAIDLQAQLTLFTSGSSGTPKPIHKTLAQFDAEVRTLETEWGALAGDAAMLASVPHHHIYGLLFRVLWPLAAGRAFDRGLTLDPQQLQGRLAEVGAALVVSTPAQLSRWPELEGFAALASAPRAFFSSGGPLDEATALVYAAAFGAAPIEIYGSTETGGIAWRRQNERAAWTPVFGVDVRRADDGALNVRSPHLGHDRWHRTDDAIALDADGRFRLQGRLDRVVKLDGKRVSLPELEMRLAAHPHVAQVAITPLAGATRERVGALVALSAAGRDALHAGGRVALAKTLRRYLAAYFDVVALPRYWRFRMALPFDARGKLPAAAVAAAFDARADGAEVLAETRDGDALRYELRVPPGLVHFDGHFPGLPILPGVVQIDWAIRLASEHFTNVREVASIDRLKFLVPVPPGAVLHLTLAHDAARRRVQFGYRLGERDCASGVIVYREQV
ncbi:MULTISPECIES: AMP-binding protein [Paraburkholderia]|uniref:AMP-binding protein n=1 Tax=Paraburkholderia TaxID=1822464 RepID=UPI0022516387|nr:MULTISPECIES: AMP-binding protein [Paraburkholderia]MCX4160848.1 AMP-binding protein [Paraburkholderia megapolitana]MDN7156345.1 AMP-binding protein [Paraburkholderia sp. CHISQ3]MDQ6493390.1 AMP-binding protein [Paraburkholderia megapolitana]